MTTAIVSTLQGTGTSWAFFLGGALITGLLLHIVLTYLKGETTIIKSIGVVLGLKILDRVLAMVTVPFGAFAVIGAAAAGIVITFAAYMIAFKLSFGKTILALVLQNVLFYAAMLLVGIVAPLILSQII